MLTLTVAMLVSPALAQTSDSCATLYDHGDRGVILCAFTAGDSTIYTKREITSSSVRDVTITEVTYRKLMEQDTADVAAHTAQLQANIAQSEKETAEIVAHLDAINKAAAITKKKPCIAAGFAWAHGGCSVKDGR